MSRNSITFTPLSINSRDEITDFVSKFPPYSDFNFISLYSWNIDNSTLYTFDCGNLIIKLSDYLTGESVYSVLGDNRIGETVDRLLAYLHSIGEPPLIKLVPEVVVQQLDNASYNCEEDHDNHDYILSTRLLSELRASEFRGRRSETNRFLRNYGDSIKTEMVNMSLTSSKEQIINVLNTWLVSSDKANKESEPEAKAIYTLMEQIDSLKAICMGVYYKNKLIAFSVIEIVNKDYAINHFEKADLSFAGIFSYLKKATCSWLVDENVKFLNHEQDLGIPGLRRSKELFHPVNKLKKYTISYKH